MTDIDSMITNYNTTLTDTASEILGKERQRTTPWSPDMFLISAVRGEIRRRAGNILMFLMKHEGVKEYRTADKSVQKTLKKAKEDSARRLKLA